MITCLSRRGVNPLDNRPIAHRLAKETTDTPTEPAMTRLSPRHLTIHLPNLLLLVFVDIGVVSVLVLSRALRR